MLAEYRQQDAGSRVTDRVGTVGELPRVVCKTILAMRSTPIAGKRAGGRQLNMFSAQYTRQTHEIVGQGR